MFSFVNRRSAVLCAVSVSALLSGAPAFAQGADETKAAADNGTGLEELVVTARRREERLQDVPVAVTAMTPQRLKDAQVTTARQLVTLVPGLNVNTGNQRDYQRFTIRGQGATVGAGEGVTVYFAEAPLPQFVAGGPGLYYDLENLQVLNGPQGTLFGRNTTGGAVLFTPQKPTNRNEGFIQTGLGNYNNLELTGALNWAAIPDKLAIRVAGEVRQRDGYTKSVQNGSQYDNIDYSSYRATILFTPTESIQNSLLMMYNRSTTGGTGVIVTDVNPTGNGARTYGAANLNAVLAAQGPLGVRLSQSGAQHWWFTKNVSAINTTTVQLPGDLTLKNITSFTRQRVSSGFDIDGTPYPLVEYVKHDWSTNSSGQGVSRNDYLTEELQLGGKALDDKLTWVTGGFWQHYYPYGYQAQDIVQFGGRTIGAAYEKGTTDALFGQATLDLGVFTPALDNLKLTAGYRYAWDKKSYVSDVYTLATGACSGQPTKVAPNCAVLFKTSSEAPTYTLGLDYKVTPTTLVYGTVRSGYKAGGFNASADPSFPYASFGPEKVTDYEIGLKSDFHLGGVPVRTNLAAFHDDYKDVQRNQSFIIPNSLPLRFVNLVGNAAGAKIDGFEAQVFARLFDSLDVDVNYSYLDSRYTNFVLNGVDKKGVALPYSPKNKVGGSVKYHLPLDPALGDISLNASANYQSTYRWGDEDQPGNLLGDYTLVNLGASWNHINGRPVDLEAFVTNVGNKAYKAGSLAYYTATGVSAASYTEPRMYGVRLRYTFGAQ
jgi:iron complex outermembrane receptor protein